MDRTSKRTKPPARPLRVGIATAKGGRRAEGKARTRRALLDAALRLLPTTGYAGLTGSAVAREAGVAQPTFYVHFRDKDDLVRSLVADFTTEVREGLLRARARIVAKGTLDDLKESYRVPLATWIRLRDLFPVWSRELRNPASPIGDAFREMFDEMRQDLTKDLESLWKARGLRRDPTETRILAEMMLAHTDAMASAYVEGRFTDLEQIVDVLARSTATMLGVPFSG